MYPIQHIVRDNLGNYIGGGILDQQCETEADLALQVRQFIMKFDNSSYDKSRLMWSAWNNGTDEFHFWRMQTPETLASEASAHERGEPEF